MKELDLVVSLSNQDELFNIVYSMMNKFLNPISIDNNIPIDRTLSKTGLSLGNLIILTEIFKNIPCGTINVDSWCDTRLYTCDSHTDLWIWNKERLIVELTKEDLITIFQIIIGILKK